MIYHAHVLVRRVFEILHDARDPVCCWPIKVHRAALFPIGVERLNRGSLLGARDIESWSQRKRHLCDDATKSNGYPSGVEQGGIGVITRENMFSSSAIDDGKSIYSIMEAVEEGATSRSWG